MLPNRIKQGNRVTRAMSFQASPHVPLSPRVYTRPGELMFGGLYRFQVMNVYKVLGSTETDLAGKVLYVCQQKLCLLQLELYFPLSP